MAKKVLFTRQVASFPQSCQIPPDLHYKSFYIIVSSKTTMPPCLAVITSFLISQHRSGVWCPPITISSSTQELLFPLFPSYRRQQPPLPFGWGIPLKSSRISYCFSLSLWQTNNYNQSFHWPTTKSGWPIMHWELPTPSLLSCHMRTALITK